MIPLKKAEELIQKHKNLENDLSSGNLDNKLFASKSKEYSDLNEIINNIKKNLDFEKNKKDLEKIINDTSSDKEIREMAEIELDELTKNNDFNEKKIKLFLLPKDDADAKNAIIEIRAGTGGLEASLFASDLFKMYEKVCHKKKWTLEIISISKSEAGGLNEVIDNIKVKIFILFLSMRVEYIVCKEFRTQKLKEEFILQRQLLQYFLSQRKLMLRLKRKI